jgi:hypothetical protein
MLDTIKGLIGFASDETDNDERLLSIISLTTAKLKNKLGGIDPPEELDYIVIEVAIKRFNRIGSEGLKNHSVEGESLTFDDNDFDEFADDMQDFLNRQKEGTKGKVCFI